MRARLHITPSWPSDQGRPLSEGGDFGLLGFLLGVHLLLLVGFLAGIGWGDAVAGYATAVVVIAGRELVREFARWLWRRNESRRA